MDSENNAWMDYVITKNNAIVGGYAVDNKIDAEFRYI